MSLKKKNFFFYLFSIPPHSLFTNHVISFLLFTAFRIMQATTNYTKIKSERFNMARKATPLSFSPWSLSKRRRPVRSPSAVLSRAPALAVPCVCHAPTLFSPHKAQPLFARAAAPTAPPHTGRSCPPPPKAAPSVPFASSPALLVRDPLPRPNVIEHPMPGSWGRGRGWSWAQTWESGRFIFQLFHSPVV